MASPFERKNNNPFDEPYSTPDYGSTAGLGEAGTGKLEHVSMSGVSGGKRRGVDTLTSGDRGQNFKKHLDPSTVPFLYF